MSLSKIIYCSRSFYVIISCPFPWNFPVLLTWSLFCLLTWSKLAFALVKCPFCPGQMSFFCPGQFCPFSCPSEDRKINMLRLKIMSFFPVLFPVLFPGHFSFALVKMSFFPGIFLGIFPLIFLSFFFICHVQLNIIKDKIF